VVLQESTVPGQPTFSKGCLCTYIGTVFFLVLGWGFLVLRISFWLLSFGILSDLQLDDSDVLEFLNDIPCVPATFSQVLELWLQFYETKPELR